MLLPLLQFFATKFLVLALHLEAGSFPRPLNAKEEIETFALPSDGISFNMTAINSKMLLT